jgi:hypothetical protein
MSRRFPAWVFLVGLAALGCGRYGPPVRAPQAAPPWAPTPAAATSEPAEEPAEPEPPTER